MSQKRKKKKPKEKLQWNIPVPKFNPLDKVIGVDGKPHIVTGLICSFAYALDDKPEGPHNCWQEDEIQK